MTLIGGAPVIGAAEAAAAGAEWNLTGRTDGTVVEMVKKIKFTPPKKPK